MLVFIGALTCFAIVSIPSIHLSRLLAIAANVLIVAVGLSFLGILAASAWNLIKRRWAKGIITLLMLLIGGITFVFVFIFLMFEAMVGPSEDGFGKDIVIPPNMKVESPVDPQNAPATDGDAQALIASFSTNSTDIDSREISVDLPVLNEFAGQNRTILLRHLATSSKWFMSKQQTGKGKGKLYAYRRCFVNGRQNNPFGYYSESTFDMQGRKSFQFRIIIGMDGRVMGLPWKDQVTMANISDRAVQLKVIDDKYGHGVESDLVLESKGATLEIFEQSQSHRRPFTRLALQQIDSELRSVLSSPVAQQRGFDPSLMPPESIKTGESEIYIENGTEGGIYFVCAYANPGEPGYAYLKVFEAIRNTPLSTRKILERSTKYIGWSDDPTEQFFHNSEIIVQEGERGVYYPARFELWFVPDSGKPERKLIEKIFKIEGWQR